MLKDQSCTVEPWMYSIQYGGLGDLNCLCQAYVVKYFCVEMSDFYGMKLFQIRF